LTAWIYFGFHFLDNLCRTKVLLYSFSNCNAFNTYARSHHPYVYAAKAGIFEIQSALPIFIGSLKYGLISSGSLSSLQPMSGSSAVPPHHMKNGSSPFRRSESRPEEGKSFPNTNPDLWCAVPPCDVIFVKLPLIMWSAGFSQVILLFSSWESYESAWLLFVFCFAEV
jgi:hypothetical protein